jgi:hypothetical protein
VGRRPRWPSLTARNRYGFRRLLHISTSSKKLKYNFDFQLTTCYTDARLDKNEMTLGADPV